MHLKFYYFIVAIFLLVCLCACEINLSFHNLFDWYVVLMIDGLQKLFVVVSNM